MNCNDLNYEFSPSQTQLCDWKKVADSTKQLEGKLKDCGVCSGYNYNCKSYSNYSQEEITGKNTYTSPIVPERVYKPLEVGCDGKLPQPLDTHNQETKLDNSKSAPNSFKSNLSLDAHSQKVDSLRYPPSSIPSDVLKEHYNYELINRGFTEQQAKEHINKFGVPDKMIKIIKKGKII